MNSPRGKNTDLLAQLKALPGNGSVTSTIFFWRKHLQAHPDSRVCRNGLQLLVGIEYKSMLVKSMWDGRYLCGHLWEIQLATVTRPGFKLRQSEVRNCDLNC